MKKGMVYTTGMTVLMIFLYISISVMISKYTLHQQNLSNFLTFEKVSHIMNAIKNNFYETLGINVLKMSELRFIFPLSNDSFLKNQSVKNLETFINTIYKMESYTSISLNVSNASDQLSIGNNSYLLNNSLLRAYENNNTIIIPDKDLSELSCNITSDASFTMDWSEPYSSGSFNFTILNETQQSWLISKGSGVLNLTFDKGVFAGYVILNLSVSGIIIDASNVDFSVVDNVNITLEFGNLKVRPAFNNSLIVEDYLGLSSARVII